VACVGFINPTDVAGVSRQRERERLTLSFGPICVASAEDGDRI
jgi:hypothetical protein